MAIIDTSTGDSLCKPVQLSRPTSSPVGWACLALGLLLSIGCAPDTANSTVQDGWNDLFNGHDLQGWTQRNGTATYRIEGECIVGTTSEGSPNSFLCTDRDYANFELTFEVQVDDRLNSGVQIRSHSRPEFGQGRVHGPQVEIEASPGEAGYIYSEGTDRGWLSSERTVTDAFQNGRWNRYRVVATGERIQTWINDIKIADVHDAQSPKSGFIGLQVHSIPREQGPYEVRWRNLRLREISSY